MEFGSMQDEEKKNNSSEKKKEDKFIDMLFPGSKNRLVECAPTKDKAKKKMTDKERRAKEEKKGNEEALNSLMKFKSIMGMDLHEAVKTMVTHGVTRSTARTRKVKAVKSMWRDKSFDEMKEVLEQAPFKDDDKAEPRKRLPPRTPQQEEELGSEYQDDSDEVEGEGTGETDDKEKQARVQEATERKENVKAELESLLVADVDKLRQDAEQTLDTCLAKALRNFRQAEHARQQALVQQVFYDMKGDLKNYKRETKRSVKKHYWRSRLALWEELEEWFKGDHERRVEQISHHLRLGYNVKLSKLKEEYYEQLDEKLKSTKRRWERQLTALVEEQRRRHRAQLTQLRRNLFLAYCDLATSSKDRVASRLARLQQDWVDGETAEARAAAASIMTAMSSIASVWHVPGEGSLMVRPPPWQHLAHLLHQRYLALARQVLGPDATHVLTFADVHKYKDAVIKKKKEVSRSEERARTQQRPKWAQMESEETLLRSSVVEQGSRDTVSMVLSLVESLVTAALPPPSSGPPTSRSLDEVLTQPESVQKTAVESVEAVPSLKEEAPEGQVEELIRIFKESPGLRRVVLKI